MKRLFTFIISSVMIFSSWTGSDTCVAQTTTVTYNGHEYVDLGLPSGTLWATCNMGASTPAEFGDYYMWGYTEPSKEFGWSNYKYANGDRCLLNKYCDNSDYGTYDGILMLEPSDDAATVNWGEHSRIPYRVDGQELFDYCSMSYNEEGCTLTGPNGKSIFIPKAGRYTDGEFREEECTFWLDSVGGAYNAYEFSLRKFAIHGTQRANGLPIRPVYSTKCRLLNMDSQILSMSSGSTHALSVSVLPADALNKSLTWSSDNESVAIVDAKGVVTAISKGGATIRVATNDGSGLYRECFVEVDGGSDIVNTDAHWTFDCTKYENDMMVYLSVTENGVASKNADKLEVAAFINGECRGIASENTNGIFALRIWGNEITADVSFKIAAKGRDLIIDNPSAASSVSFTSNGRVGTPSAPYTLEVGSLELPDLYTWTSTNKGIPYSKSEVIYSFYITNDQVLRLEMSASCEDNDHVNYYFDGCHYGYFSGLDSRVTGCWDFSEGQHTLRVEYVKDGRIDAYDDIAKVDVIKLLDRVVNDNYNTLYERAKKALSAIDELQTTVYNNGNEVTNKYIDTIKGLGSDVFDFREKTIYDYLINNTLRDNILKECEKIISDYETEIGNLQSEIEKYINRHANDISVSGTVTIDDNTQTSDEMSIYVNNSYYGEIGHLTVNRAEPLNVWEFRYAYDFQAEYWQNGNSLYNGYRGSVASPTLICNSTVNADNVKIMSYFRTSNWQFVCFPFDVKVSEIYNKDKVEYYIYKYSGANRASRQGNTWIQVTADDILNAYEGYIIMMNEVDSNGWNYSARSLTFPAYTNGNNLFKTSDHTTGLSVYKSELAHNSGWNLIGNPYPCYYDSRCMDYTAPITVWYANGENYLTWSPVDDSYILAPGEAFFVQATDATTSIHFPEYGRQSDVDVHPLKSNAKRMTGDRSNREVYNLLLTEGEKSDRARFVINEKAKNGYDPTMDASKFDPMSNEAVQLYVVNNGVKYAIDERPMGDGIVNLGMRITESGSHTLSLGDGAKQTITLYDAVTQTETVLNNSDYTFNAAKGTYNNRFTLSIADSVTGIKQMENAEVTTENADCYNLNGQRVNGNAKGLYIKNGRKVVVK